MTYFNVLVFVVILSWRLHLCSSASGNGDNYVQDVCSVTLYPDLCIHSLSSFSNKAKRDPRKWAKAGVSVAINESKSVARYLMTLKKNNVMMGGRNRAALLDCIEILQDTLDNLYKSLGVLKKLNDLTFNDQMGDVITWISAALSDEDTCLDGFDGQDEEEQVKLLNDRVTNVSYITSNALAIVTKLATTGVKNLTDP